MTKMLAAVGRRMAAARAAAATGAAARLLSVSAGGSEAERTMHAALVAQLEAVHVKVTDVSGGCGSMFDVEVVSPQFVGQTRVKQHRMVNEVRVGGVNRSCGVQRADSCHLRSPAGAQGGDQGHARTHDPHLDAGAVREQVIGAQGVDVILMVQDELASRGTFHLGRETHGNHTVTPRQGHSFPLGRLTP